MSQRRLFIAAFLSPWASFLGQAPNWAAGRSESILAKECFERIREIEKNARRSASRSANSNLKTLNPKRKTTSDLRRKIRAEDRFIALLYVGAKAKRH